MPHAAAPEPPRNRRARPTRHDPRGRPADAVPADARGPAVRQHSRRGSRSSGWRRSASTICAAGASAGTAASTTTPTAAGAGMVLRPEPVAAAFGELRGPDSTVILPDPAGDRFTQATARSLATASHLIFLCPRYEGVDERIRSLVDLELSIGDYVLSGGELPALVIVDAVLRLLPGAIEGRIDRDRIVLRRPAGVSAVHATGQLSRLGRAADPGQRRPRRGSAMAAARIARSDAAAAPGPAGGPPSEPGGAVNPGRHRGRVRSRPTSGAQRRGGRDGVRAMLYSAVGRPVRPLRQRSSSVNPRSRAAPAPVAQHR